MNATGARRPYRLARHLADQGHPVTVLTGAQSADDSWQVDLSGITVHRFKRGGLDSINGPWRRWLARWCMEGPEGRMKAIARSLAFFLLPVEFISRPNIPSGDALRMCPRPDILVATGPGWSMLEVGHRLAAHWKCTFLVDYRDPWVVHDDSIALRTTTWYGNGVIGHLRRGWLRILEKRYTTGIHGATAATAPLMENTRRSIPPVPVRTILNGTDPLLRRTAAPQNGRVVVLHAGRLYHEQDWASVIQALHQLHRTGVSGKDLQLVLLGATSESSGLLTELNACAARTGLIRLEDRVTREEVAAWMDEADLLLHLGFRGKRGILPLKLLEYLSADRPILQLSAENTEVEEAIARTRTGMIVPDADSFHKALEEVLMLKRKGERPVHEPDRDAISAYGWGVRMEEWRAFILDIHRSKEPEHHAE